MSIMGFLRCGLGVGTEPTGFRALEPIELTPKKIFLCKENAQEKGEEERGFHSRWPGTAALTSVHLGKGLQSRQSLFTVEAAMG